MKSRSPSGLTVPEMASDSWVSENAFPGISEDGQWDWPAMPEFALAMGKLRVKESFKFC